MPDINKTIKALTEWIEDPNAMNAEIDGSLVSDALVLLKEQQTEIDRLKGEKEKAVEKTKEQIVEYDKQAIDSDYAFGVGNGLRYALEIFTGNGGEQECGKQ